MTRRIGTWTRRISGYADFGTPAAAPPFGGGSSCSLILLEFGAWVRAGGWRRPGGDGPAGVVGRGAASLLDDG